MITKELPRLFGFLPVLAFAIVSCDDDAPTMDQDSLPAPHSGAVTFSRYSARFEATWSLESHPTDFPSNAHFSGLIGLTHYEKEILFQCGELATPGIIVMAETGSKGPLMDEIEELQSKGTALTYVSGSGISRSPGSAQLEFRTSSAYPLVTIVSMLAPSPDWFIAVSNLNLIPAGTWLSDTSIAVSIYDAGSDSGSTFLSANQATDPPQPISPITDSPLGTDGTVSPLGTFVFTRLE